MSIRILHGDCRTILATLPADSVQCCVTSPPYFGLRDYGVDGQIGLEPSPDEYVAELVAVFRKVRRVLRADGTMWLNLGDSYSTGSSGDKNPGTVKQGDDFIEKAPRRLPTGTKPKDLLMIPARVALALQADGWWLRSDIIWHKPNPMPESVTDRPTSAHEHVFLLTKSPRYFYDLEAIREPISETWVAGGGSTAPKNGPERMAGPATQRRLAYAEPKGANARNVWTIATQPFSGAHFATMPPDLVERCIKAGSRPGDMILDPFGGAGTTGLVADRLNRNATLIELNPAYAEMARERIVGDAPLLAVAS